MMMSRPARRARRQFSFVTSTSIIAKGLLGGRLEGTTAAYIEAHKERCSRLFDSAPPRSGHGNSPAQQQQLLHLHLGQQQHGQRDHSRALASPARLPRTMRAARSSSISRRSRPRIRTGSLRPSLLASSARPSCPSSRGQTSRRSSLSDLEVLASVRLASLTTAVRLPFGGARPKRAAIADPAARAKQVLKPSRLSRSPMSVSAALLYSRGTLLKGWLSRRDHPYQPQHRDDPNLAPDGVRGVLCVQLSPHQRQQC